MEREPTAVEPSPEVPPGTDSTESYRQAVHTKQQQHVLIAQFASSDPEELARAADLISPWVDGVDLNCGCPQSWAIKEGIGCSLMENPELVAQILRATKERIGPGKSVSCKIRIHKDLSKTINWVKTVQQYGCVDYITVHGRTRSQRSSTPPDYAAIRALREHITVPLIANGDAYTLSDVHNIASLTAANGVMAARGILENPTLFTGLETTSPQCVRRFMEISVQFAIPFALVLHHVAEMSARMPGMDKKARKVLMECADMLDLIDYVDERWSS